MRLATSLKNIDGPYSPKVGYDRAVADDLRFDVRARLAAPGPLRPPAAHVPRYDHVFLFYFENQDVRAIVGDRRTAPYYNSLLSQGSELGQMYAEEHPSDGNYLALAGGSTFGIPLTDPLEVNSQYTIHAANIGDRIDAAGETWKDYEQSSAGPCDDTVHGFYWDDDLPMLYFADIRDRPAYCAAHDVPLASMASDLSQAATTPNFSWVGINDCDDMEGCGIRAGDRFLATATRGDHALAGVANAALARDHHLRRGRHRSPATGPAHPDADAGIHRSPPRLRVEGPVHALQPAADDRGGARSAGP